MEKCEEGFSIRELSQVLGVSESGYYRWRSNKVTAHEQRDIQLATMVKSIFHTYKSRYGAPRIHMELKEMGEKVSRKRVARLMKENNIFAKKKRKYKFSTKSEYTGLIAPNLLEQKFKVDLPNQIWVADLSYVWTQEGWVYLAIVLDLYSRKVVGWHINDRMTKELVIEAFLKAYWARKPKAGLIHHSDRGSQYASYEFQRILSKAGVKISMSAKGNCFDNAVAESFFSTLKTELVYNRNFKTKSEAKSAIFEYIEIFYNRERRHSKLNYCSPAKFDRYSLGVA